MYGPVALDSSSWTPVTCAIRTGIHARCFRMTSADNGLMDFRSRAVAESEAIRRRLRNGLSLDKSGVSYCVERQPSLSRLRAPIKIIAIACLGLCISGVATDGVIALPSKRAP